MFKYLSAAISIGSCLLLGVAAAQAQTSTQNSTVGDNSNGNTVQQSNPQNNQQITFPNIYPLNPVIQNPVNTENDLGINLGAGVNTLDSRNVTIYLGITYQPGRTNDHNARMAKLKSETQLLEAQKQATQTQLELLKQQVTEQEIRIRRLQSGGQAAPK
jgi:opacity protein-like surface antigen